MADAKKTDDDVPQSVNRQRDPVTGKRADEKAVQADDKRREKAAEKEQEQREAPPKKRKD